ncbi:AMP-binding protein [Eubacterium xylanophilum]|uniref:AMP-binding protein n=1 Tax=Eubacterium xylanophilum TaxID=39497 RepID=UPI0004B4133B|nr:AMP-binding protein [Eubacterium xylanophilum]
MSSIDNLIASRYIEVEEDSEGVLQNLSYKNDEDFNFAYDIVDELAKKCPKKLAMIHVSNRGKLRRFTFSDMSRYSSKVANYLSFLGIKKGDRVMLVLKRNYQFWFAILALHKIGAIAIPTSEMLLKSDFEYRFKKARVDAVICTAVGNSSNEIDKAVKKYNGLKAKILVGSNKKGWRLFNKELKYFSDVYKRPVEENAIHGDDPSVMFFTSGTTSYPKIACHDFRYPLGHFVTAYYWHQVRPGSVHLAIADTGWAKALWGKIYGQWMSEATIFTDDFDNFDAKEILKMIETYKISSFCAPPTVYRVLVHLKLDGYDLSSLKSVTTAGEALNSEVLEKFRNKTGLTIHEGFGQSESTLMIGNIKGTEIRPGSMGKALPHYDLAIMRNDGTFADPGEVGEIVVNTKNGKPNGLFLGYLEDEEKTNSVWYDGYYHTGDTAYIDEDGYFWYCGRADDVIKSSGYRIGPYEIENEIMKLPYVRECAVTPVPDPIRGQTIKASIVLIDSVDGSDKLKNDIMKSLKANIASYKWPKVLEFTKELPKTISGKIRRKEIRLDSAREAEKKAEEVADEEKNEDAEK